MWRIDVIDDEIELARIIGGEVTPRLARLKSPMDVVMAARAFEADGYAREAIAYSFARFGNVEEALTSLRRLTREFDRAIPWQRRAAERTERLVALLLTDPGQARRQLDEWESETAQGLQLPRTN